MPSNSQRLKLLLWDLRNNRKPGWGRPWNQEGIELLSLSRPIETVSNQKLLLLLHTVMKPLELTDEEQTFITSLLEDPDLQLFIIEHQRERTGVQLKGVTVSAGRRIGLWAYDRIDLMLEMPVDHATLSRASVFISPYAIFHQNEFTMLTPEMTDTMQALYSMVKHLQPPALLT